jgi:hypothetical protein
MHIIQAVDDRNLLGRFFEDKSTWQSWLAFLKAIFALPMTKKEFVLYQQCTGRHQPPNKSFQEIICIVGRRGGKSWIVSLVAVYLAFFCDYRKYLAPGEMGTILVIAVDQVQARIILRYIKAVIQAVPMFRDKLVKERAMDLELSNRVQIMIRTCSLSSVRGYTLVAAILEEVSFWRVDGVNPDHEVLTAIRPGLATIPGSMLLAISSPYGRQGIMFEAHRDHFANDGSDVLVWHAATRLMNPTISEDYIQKELAKDPEAARAEWLAEFGKDLESFLPLEWIERASVPSRYELPPNCSFTYQAFCDPSGGAGDAFTLSIGHTEGERLVQDYLLRVPPPSNPHHVTKRCVEAAKLYGINTIKGDKYADRWVSDAFEAEGINYVQSKRSKSDLYLELAPLLAQGRCKFLITELRRQNSEVLREGPGEVVRTQLIIHLAAMMMLTMPWPD